MAALGGFRHQFSVLGFGQDNVGMGRFSSNWVPEEYAEFPDSLP